MIKNTDLSGFKIVFILLNEIIAFFVKIAII